MLYRAALAAFVLSSLTWPALVEAKVDTCALHVDLSPMTATVDRSKRGSAPADIDFGLYPMSVLGIENTLRRDGATIDEGSDRSALTTGPLACVVDSIRAWERAYPADPWIAKDLLTLERVYLRAHGSDARELAVRAETWLERDYPLSNFVGPARVALANQPERDPREEFASAPREELASAPRDESASVPRNEFASAPGRRAPEQAAAEPVVLAERVVKKSAQVARAIEAFVAKPISLVATLVPPPVSPIAEFPEVRIVSSPWDRFAPLESERR